MKVMQINSVYKKGSTGKITYDMHSGLGKAGIESVVCYGRGALIEEEHVFKICTEFESKICNLISRISGIMYGLCFISTNKLIRKINIEKPDIVHLQCINGYFVNIYKLLDFLKIKAIPTVLTLHAEFMYTGGCGHSFDCNQFKEAKGCVHCNCWKSFSKSIIINNTSLMWKKMNNSFNHFDKLSVVSVSPWLMSQSKQSTILKDKTHFVVFNGIDTAIFHSYDSTDLRKKLKLEDKKIILYVTPFFNIDKNDIKGGSRVIELARMLEKENLQVLVVGPFNSEITYPSNMTLLGYVSNQKLLARYYSLADITILTSKKETFSMVVAESLCCGTPIVGMKCGAPEQIALKEYSDFFEQNDLEKMKDDILIKLKQEKPKEISEKAIKIYGKEKMVSDYISVYKELLSRV